MKITGSIENGNPVKIKEAIRRFKNETYPNIVVTVDLLTTGIDVEKIENLVFMRRIRSRILFEQMLGRATRLCPRIGKTHFEIYDSLKSMPVDKAVETVKKSRQALDYVRRMPHEHEKFLSDEEDMDTAHTRGYGDAAKPEDYLKEFRDFIDNNLNEIAALNIVATRPKELTRKSLKELKLILDRESFSETMLQTAWKEMTNEDIAADIISFIRQRSIGDALISKDDRIHNAIAGTKAAHPEFSKIQLGWLDRMEQQLLRESVLNRETFESEAFKNKGGYNAVNKAFGQKLDELIDEINDRMYSA